MLVVLADWGYQLPIRLAAFSAMASTVGFSPHWATNAASITLEAAG